MDDLLQDVFVRSYERKDLLDASYLDRYFARAARNAAMDYVRRFQPHRELSSATPAPSRDLDDVVHCQQLVSFLQPYYRRMQSDYREALECWLRGDKMVDSARERGVPYSTFLSRRNAAIRYLRRGLQEQVNPPLPE